MSEPIETEERLWERGWDGHLSAQLRRMARLPLAEKLEWLEEAQRLAEQIQAGRTGGPSDRTAGANYNASRPTDTVRGDAQNAAP